MNGFDFFETLCYLQAPGAEHIRQRVTGRFERLNIADRVRLVPAVVTPADPRIGILLSHRRILQAARDDNAGSVLVLGGDIHFLDRTNDILVAATAELAQHQWTLFYLGGWWPIELAPVPRSRHLTHARNVNNSHAVAYSRDVYTRLLDEWPANATDAADWVVRNGDIDASLGRLQGGMVVRPVVTTVPALLPFEPAATQRHFNL